MEVQLQIKMNEKLFLRDPEQTELGKKIIRHSIQLIYKNGFELFFCPALFAPGHGETAFHSFLFVVVLPFLVTVLLWHLLF